MFQTLTFAVGVLLAASAAAFRLPQRTTRVLLVVAVCLIIFAHAPGIAAWLGS